MATTVTVGGNPATDVVVSDTGTLTATVPAGTAGAADVTVTTSVGSDTLTDGYTYVEAPTADSIDPDHGPEAGGTTVTVTGTGFIDGATTVTVGDEAATDVVVVSDTELTFVTPAGTGNAAVTITTPGGDAVVDGGFTYDVAVVVTAVDPTEGPTAGGNTITITGSGFEMA